MLAFRFISLTALAAAWLGAAAMLAPGAAAAGDEPDYALRLAKAAEVVAAFTRDDAHSIPADLLARARGIAVIPNLIRGGFIIGGRRGRGVLAVRAPSGEWSNPALITLTGGSIGWQFGAESEDLVLVFANDRSVRHIEDGKFTLGGDAAAVAGPVGRRTAVALTGKAEVYAYFRGRGLFAGAAFEGARLDVDEQGGAAFYSADPRAVPLGEQNEATPGVTPQKPGVPESEGAVTFPLPE
jgi:lipid-binding SYLF domain-containing protein